MYTIATQTGANTFGCLVNGEAWVTRSGYGNLVVGYEPGANGAILNISASRSPNGKSDTKQTIKLFAGPIFQARAYAFNLAATEGTASYFDRGRPFPCDEVLNSDATYLTGNLTLTRLDERAGVISGTFEFKLAKPGCDTVRVTQGRFDHRI